MHGSRENPTRPNGFNNEHVKQAICASRKPGEDDCEIKMKKKIMKFREVRKSKKLRNLVVIKRSNKVVQALQLPKVLNLNPRSIYNKKKEFVTFVKEEEVDLICLSESWEKEHLTLDIK